ncbi:MAG: class I SAM-dependent methyltransferase [Candidatus Binatia bacterium]
MPDLGYATVEDFCDSADSLSEICQLDGDLKNVQRPWMVKAVLGRVPPGSRLLEIGAGEPLVAAALHDLGYRVTVVDPYEGAGHGPTDYEQYVRTFPDVRIIRGEFAPGMPQLAGECFDCIYSISVLEHVAHDRIGDLFAGIAELLRPGGESLHSIDHVAAGRGAAYHEDGLRAVLHGQERLRRPAAEGSADVERGLRELLRRMENDLETFYLSPQGHHQWRGGRPYREFPFRKVVSIHSCATKTR